MIVIVGGILYMVILIIISTVYINRQAKRTACADKKDEFCMAGRSLSAPVVGITIGLSGLGAAHVFGIMELSYIFGAAAIWFSLAFVISISITTFFTGPLLRKSEFPTMASFMGAVSGEKVRIMTACATCGMLWGFNTLELQGIGILLNVFAGVKIMYGCYIGAILGLAYVLISGMKEVGYINMINTFILYLCLVVAIFFVGALLIDRSWSTVNAFFLNGPESWRLSIFGTRAIMLTFTLSMVFSTVFAMVVNQNQLQAATAAKDDKTVRRAAYWAAPSNGLFGVFIVAIGLAAFALAGYHDLGPKIAGTTLLKDAMPTWMMVIMVGTLIAAILSTFAINSLAMATIFVKDVYYRANPHTTEKQDRFMMRIIIIILALVAALFSVALPTILGAVAWQCSFVAPMFFLFVFGLFWKRSETAFVITIAVAWIVNCLWSFTSLPAALSLPADINAYVTIIITIVLGIILTAVMPGKPSYLSTHKALKAAKQ